MNYRYARRMHLLNRQGRALAEAGLAQIVTRDQQAVPILLLLVIGLGLAAASRANDLPEPILDVFPDSQAPAFYEKTSNLELQRSFQPWTHNSNWHPEVDEKSVFHARLQHKSVDERCWEIGIGKGGQMYSIYATAFIVKHEDRFFPYNDRGELIIARLGAEGDEELSRARVLSPAQPSMGRRGRMIVWSHPAFANQCIYARNDKEVVWKLTRTDIGKTLPPMMQGENPIYRTTQVSLIGEEIAP